MTVNYFAKNIKNFTATAITYIVRWNGAEEVFTNLNDLTFFWGAEEIKKYWMLNTREMVIDIA